MKATDIEAWIERQAAQAWARQGGGDTGEVTVTWPSGAVTRFVVRDGELRRVRGVA